MFSRKPQVVRPKVTPDPTHVEALRKKQEALAYRPETGFHRDRVQTKKGDTWR